MSNSGPTSSLISLDTRHTRGTQTYTKGKKNLSTQNNKKFKIPVFISHVSYFQILMLGPDEFLDVENFLVVVVFIYNL